jgi:hypothetical protein
MRARIVLFIALAAAAACSSEAPDDKINPVRADAVPYLVSAQEALDTSEIATIDPHTMNDAEVSKILGSGPFCAFRYVSDGKPVLAWKRQSNGSKEVAVVKLNGVLVGLQNEADAGSNVFTADTIRLTVSGSETRQSDSDSIAHPGEAKLLFEISDQLRVGYSGYSVCPA